MVTSCCPAVSRFFLFASNYAARESGDFVVPRRWPPLVPASGDDDDDGPLCPDDDDDDYVDEARESGDNVGLRCVPLCPAAADDDAGCH